MADYAKNKATATKMLTKFGRDVTLRVVTAGTYNPATGTVSNTNADETRKAAIFAYSKGEQHQAGTLIQANDKKAYMDANGTTPDVSHKVVIDSVVYSIISVDELKPATVAILYTLQVRA